MDAWTDDGRLYLLDSEPGSELGKAGDGETPQERGELSGKMVLLNATTLLLERGRREAATVLYACELEVEIGNGLSYDDAPVWVKIKAPEQFVFPLQDLDRDLAWFVREALSESLPNGYAIAELFVQTLVSTSPHGDDRVAA